MTRAARVTALLAIVVLVGCQAAALAIPPLLNLAKNLLTTSGENHGASYVASVEELFKVFQTVTEGTKQGEQPQQQPPPQQPGQPAPPPSQSGLNVDVAMAKMAGGQLTSMNDGDVLRDAAGDRFKVVFRPHQNCYIYVLLIDATGFVQPLRPSASSGGGSASFANAGQEYELPRGGSYGLDKNKGTETVYLVVTRQANADIEQLFKEFEAEAAAQARSTVKKPVKRTVKEPVIVPGASKRKSKVRTRSSDGEVDAETYFSQLGAELVITRWFIHE